MQKNINEAFSKNAQFFSVSVPANVAKNCPEILINITEWFPPLGLKADFVRDETGNPAMKEDGTYTLVTEDDETAEKLLSNILDKKFALAVGPKKLSL